MWETKTWHRSQSYILKIIEIELEAHEKDVRKVQGQVGQEKA